MVTKGTVFSLLVAFMVHSALADTPANCSYSEILGKWTIYETARGNDNSIEGCDDPSTAEFVRKRIFELRFPDTAWDEFGNTGFWTLIYNQGFEVNLAGRKYFMFSAYDNVTKMSNCHETQAGWSHTVNGVDWACVKGSMITSVKDKADQQTVLYKNNVMRFYKNIGAEKSRFYEPNPQFVSAINSLQSSWKATEYPHYSQLTLGEMHRMAGGPKSKIAGIPHPMKPLLTEDLKKQLSALPQEFDWRNVSGRNFVSPVRNQGACGSCYAFSSMAMNEARMRVMSNLTLEPVFSTQDVVECCRYSQGCEGGFPYLVGGKYAADYGMVAEECNPYTGEDGSCSTNSTCLRTYGFHYSYVGGFYGACNEESMKLALRRGPLAVSFEVYSDFMHYKGGVYHHLEGLEDKFNPFEITNHAVLLVGYGVDAQEGPYWTVKNSWGTAWGEDGYFRIRRGTDECSIESIAVESFPVL